MCHGLLKAAMATRPAYAFSLTATGGRKSCMLGIKELLKIWMEEIRTMKNKKYQFEQLSIIFKDNIKPYLVETAEDVPFHEVRKVIEEAVLGKKLEQLQVAYDDENYSMDIWAEGFCSTILIQDELHGISYDFLNEKYTDNDKWVEIAGFNTPQNSICEDTNILLDIIITFLETGRPCKRYKWIKTKEG